MGNARLMAVVLAATLLSACGDQVGTAEAGSDLVGRWHLVEAADGASALDLAGGRGGITLRVEGGKAAGTSGCNLYAGRWRADGSTVRLAGLGGTEMACEPAVMDLEQRYLAALASVERGERAGDTLTLSGRGVLLRFEGDAPVERPALVGTTWVLESLVDGETVSTPASDGELRFLGDGVLVGDITCGPLRARYSREGDNVTVTDLHDRNPAAGRCPDDLETQHAHVVDVLRDGFTARVVGSRLTLVNAEGAGLFFRAR